MAKLEIPDNVYNWLVDFFHGHAHCTQYNGIVSALHEITASLIQGSSLGPSSYVVNAADLKAVTKGNEMTNFADDTYIIIPASNIDTRDMEIGNVETWARANNLKLNRSKCCEIIITDNRGRTQNKTSPVVLDGLHRVTSLKILGITITCLCLNTSEVSSPTAPRRYTLCESCVPMEWPVPNYRLSTVRSS